MAIFLGGIVLAGVLPPVISENAIQLQVHVTLLLALILFSFPGYRLAILQPNRSHESNEFNNGSNENHDNHENQEIHPLNNVPEIQKQTQKLSLPIYLFKLFVLQGTLFYLSLLFFYSLESHTRLNPRLQPLREGQIFEILQADFFQLSYIPWVLYSFVAMGLAYFTVCSARYPTLPNLILPKPRGAFQWLIHNYLRIVVDAVMLGPFIWLLPICMIWLCDGFNDLFDQRALMQNPLRTMLVLGFLCLFFNRSHRKLLDVIDRFKIPMGTVLVVYILLASFFIFVLNAVSGWLMLAFVNPNANTAKSLLSHALTEDMQERRLAILIWSWWALWLPWMASEIARLSLGRKLWVACLSALIFPSILFVFWQQGADVIHYQIINHILQQTWGKLTCALAIILFLFFYFRQVYSAEDFARGGLLAFGHQKRNHSLRRWMNGLIILMAGHMTALFMMGWLSVQILSTLGALVMITVLIGFTVALLSSKDFLLKVSSLLKV